MLSLWRSPISHVRRQIDTGKAVVFPNLDREEPKGKAEYLLCFLKEKKNFFSADFIYISDILNASFCHDHLAQLKHQCLTTRVYIQKKIFTMKQTSNLAKLQRILKKELLNAKHLI